MTKQSSLYQKQKYASSYTWLGILGIGGSMKSTYNTKYSYWKWVLLDKQTKLVAKKQGRPIIAVYNPTENVFESYVILDTTKTYDFACENADWIIDKYNDYETDWQTVMEEAIYFVTEEE